MGNMWTSSETKPVHGPLGTVFVLPHHKLEERNAARGETPDKKATNPQMTSRPVPSECPMHESNQKPTNAQVARGECPVKHDQNANVRDLKSGAKQVTPPSECPMHGEKIDPTNMMPLEPKQQPSPDQPFELSKDRVTSSIPRAGVEPGTKWVYPSEQMFWNAMLRKGE